MSKWLRNPPGWTPEHTLAQMSTMLKKSKWSLELPSTIYAESEDGKVNNNNKRIASTNASLVDPSPNLLKPKKSAWNSAHLFFAIHTCKWVAYLSFFPGRVIVCIFVMQRQRTATSLLKSRFPRRKPSGKTGAQWQVELTGNLRSLHWMTSPSRTHSQGLSKSGDIFQTVNV